MATLGPGTTLSLLIRPRSLDAIAQWHCAVSGALMISVLKPPHVSHRDISQMTILPLF